MGSQPMDLLFSGRLSHARSMVRGSLSGLDEAELVFRPDNCLIGTVIGVRMML